MAIYDINFFVKAIEWLPPDKRYPVNVSFAQACLSQLQYLRNKYFGNYRTGTNAPYWIPGVWGINSVVIYKQVLYQSLIDNNTDNPPSPNWQIYLPSFIGTDTRVLFNGHYVVLTFALNAYFNVPPYAPCNFRQPGLLGYNSTGDATHARYSDIYITDNGIQSVGFRIGATEAHSSSIAKTDISGKAPWSIAATYSIGSLIQYNRFMYLSLINGNIGNEPQPITDDGIWHKTDAINFSSPFLNDNEFTIWVPTRIYNSVQNIQQDIRNFLANIVPIGVNYIIKPY